MARVPWTVHFPQEGSIPFQTQRELGSCHRRPFADLQHALEERLGFSVLALGFKNRGHAAEGAGHLGMIGPENPLPDSQRALEQR